MSLNGLDEPQVKEAYEAAAAEPGGWFLLKYSSRDEVDLLGRGNGGIVEMRNNISQYEETSPLFGFLKYRRRNVLIRYLPDDCSRLVQARVTVHFNALCEKYTPYHTTFSITTAKELKDSKLSAACSLHAQSGSTSSSTSSLRRRRLMEIAEEEEEEQQRATKRSSTVLEDGNDEKEEQENEDDTKTPPASPPPVMLNADLASSPEHSKFASSEDPPDFMGADRPTSSQTTDDGRRLSSQTARPDLYSYATYTYGKPKVKLGPRPSLDVTGHPNPSNGNFRPVSQMPTGFKTYSKGSKRVKANEEKSLAESALDTSDIPFAPASIPIPDTPFSAPSDGPRPQSSSDARPVTSSGASHRSPTMSTFSASAKNTMTPEKARLMKAMKLREKKKKNANKPSATEAASPQSPNDASSAADADTESLQSPVKTDDQQGEHQLETLTEEEEKRQSQAKLDSSIVVDASVESLPTDPSESARSDSRPASPLVPSSEHDQSTKASSVSESTDETAKEPEGDADAHNFKPGTPVESTEKASDADAPADNDEPTAQLEQDTQETAATPNGDVDVKETIVEVSQFHKDEPDTPATAKADQETEEENLPENASGGAEGNLKETPEDSQAMDSHPADTKEEALEQPIETESTVGREQEPEQQEPEGKEPTSSTSPSGLAIPKSKFSTSNPGSPTGTTFTLPTIAPPPPPLPEGAAELVSSAPQTEGGAEDGETPTLTTPPPVSRRKPMEPIRTDLTPSENQSQADLSDDDELLDELQSATVQEARPMTVSKSPMSPVFPNLSSQTDSNDKDFPQISRTISNPLRGHLLAPADVSQSSARSVSAGAAYLHKITQQQTSSRENLIPKNGKLGSNISQRIKALEKLSSHPAENPAPSRSQSTRSNAPSATFFSVNKSREPSRSPSVADRASSLTRGSPHRGGTTAVESREGSPEVRVPRERSGSVASRLSMFEQPGMPSADTMPRGRPESISVTAKILRDPSQSGGQPELLKDPSEFNRLELKQSPLEVNHQMAEPPILPQPEDPHKETIRERRMSKEKRRSQSENRDEDDGNSRRRSLSIVRDFIKDRRKSVTSSSNEVLTAPPVSSAKGSPSRPPSTHNNSGNSISRRLSISSRRSSISKDAAAGALSPSAMTEASGSGDDSKSTKSEKMKSRAGKFMRRLSSSISSGRGKNLTPSTLSPTVHEEELQAENPIDMRGVSRGSSMMPPASTIQYFGDVNVQFPDNLLWKRRTLGIDTQGFLILAATASAATNSRPATGVKRYHLSDFRSPYTPDVEVQELPNSVVLDLVDGSGIQLACEDRAGQKELLHILTDAHQSHATFGQ